MASPWRPLKKRRTNRRPARSLLSPPAARNAWIEEFPHHPDASRRLPVDAPGRRRLPMLLRRAWYGLNQAFRHLTAKEGITPDQFTVLRTLHEHDRFQLTQIDLAEKMSSDPNTIASLVQRMEHQALIERRTSAEDRRAHSLALRPGGERRYRRVRRQALTLQQSILAALPEPGREGFLAQLETVANACRQAAHIGRTAGVPPRPRNRTRQRGQRR